MGKTWRMQIQSVQQPYVNNKITPFGGLKIALDFLSLQ